MNIQDNVIREYLKMYILSQEHIAEERQRFQEG